MSQYQNSDFTFSDFLNAKQTADCHQRFTTMFHFETWNCCHRCYQRAAAPFTWCTFVKVIRELWVQIRRLCKTLQIKSNFQRIIDINGCIEQSFLLNKKMFCSSGWCKSSNIRDFTTPVNQMFWFLDKWKWICWQEEKKKLEIIVSVERSTWGENNQPEIQTNFQADLWDFLLSTVTCFVSTTTLLSNILP